MHYGVWLLIFLRKEQMQMKLVLAEKPSVAQSIAKVLGAVKREELAQKYYAMAEAKPDLKVDIFGGNEQEVDLNRSQRAVFLRC